MTSSETARRNVCFLNPDLERGGTSQTIVAGMQIVKPGEVAWAHRHPIAALRFVIEGRPGLYTVVDGECLDMEVNDLVLTPAWCWHDHHNESDGIGLWLDVLDVPLMAAMGQMAYEPLGETTQPVRTERSEYISERVGVVRPLWEKQASGPMAYRYPWKVVKSQLDLYCEGGKASPYDDVIVEYIDPRTGGPALPTMRCAVQKLRKGFNGDRHRRTASTVFYVVEGTGTCVIEGKRFTYGPRDVFVVPPWAWHEHQAGVEGATLFSVSDAPLLEAAHLYREEPTSAVHSISWPAKPLDGRAK